MSHQFLVQQLAGGQVDHPQPLLSRGTRVVDYREGLGGRRRARANRAGGGVQCQTEHIIVDRAEGGAFEMFQRERRVGVRNRFFVCRCGGSKHTRRENGHGKERQQANDGQTSVHAGSNL